MAKQSFQTKPDYTTIIRLKKIFRANWRGCSELIDGLNKREFPPEGFQTAESLQLGITKENGKKVN